MPVQISDDAGVRNLAYNSYNELETDSLVADSVTHLVTELRDDFGRSVGYTYAKNGSVQQTVSTGYGSDGRISTAGFVHGGAVKQFNYAYMNGTHLLQTLTMPNNMSLTQSFEEKRDLLTQMDYKRGNTLVSRRAYTYDTLGRPLTRQTSRNGQTVDDSFVHTYRSELASAQVNGQTYAYDYDNIGNRRMSIDASDYAFYDANELNQYSSIRRNEDLAFVPTFDATGNQTLVKTATGTWSVTYNAENRPVIFQKTTDSVTTRIKCTYDYMDRRATKKVEEITTDADGNETTTLISNHRFIYRGYLQIGCCDLTRANHPCLWLITWDPTQPIATRPLAIQKDGNWFCYGWDLTKNICEIFGPSGYIRTAYTYAPFGSVTASGDVIQPIQWSSEYHDIELALVYYNYRHYNPSDGRWINRDPIAEQGGWNLYGFVGNSINKYDILGQATAYCCNKKGKPIKYNDTYRCCCDKKIKKKENFVVLLVIGCASEINFNKHIIEAKKTKRTKIVFICCARKTRNLSFDEKLIVKDHNNIRTNAYIFPDEANYKLHEQYNPNRGDISVNKAVLDEMKNIEKEAMFLCDDNCICCNEISVKCITDGDSGYIWKKYYSSPSIKDKIIKCKNKKAIKSI